MCSKHIPHQCLVVNHEYYIHGLKSWSYIVICTANGFVQELSIVCLDTLLEQDIFKLALEITLAKLLKKKKGTYSKIRLFTSRVNSHSLKCLSTMGYAPGASAAVKIDYSFHTSL